MSDTLLPASTALKLDLMLEGVRYSEALGRAGDHSFPSFVQHRVEPGEYDPDGSGRVTVPYILILEDGTHCRIKVAKNAPWSISGSESEGYTLRRDASEPLRVEFEPPQKWMHRPTGDGTAGAVGVLRIHGDMAIMNVAPGCQYFTAPKQAGVSMRCTFCTYGAPDQRTGPLGQQMDRVEIPASTLQRLSGVLSTVLAEADLQTIYLVGGSLTDWKEEGRRFVQLARSVQEIVDHRVPVSCGSGALDDESLRVLHEEGLVDSICFNLEVWSEPLFAKVCPGKHRYVGYENWLRSLELAVQLWGKERVYTAMVGGVELVPELTRSVDEALELALQGAEDLCSRGILPIYSLYWPSHDRDAPDHLRDLHRYFEQLQAGYAEVRQRHDLSIWPGFMTRRSAYMQLECDLDHAAGRETRDE